MSSDSYDVLVVGAGVAGMAFVVALRDAGLCVAIVDKEPSADGRKLGWGNDLQPNGLLALESLGVLEEVKRLGVLHHHWYAQRVGGGILSRWDYDKLYHSHSYAVCIRPHLLRQALRQKAVGLATVISAKFIGCRRGAGYYEVLLTGIAGLQVIKTKLLVAADGPFSLVREAAMLKCAMRRYRYSWANTILARNPDDVREGHVFFGRGVYLGVVPTQANELVIFHLTTSESAAQYQQQFGTIAALRQQYTQIAPILKECMHNIRSWDQVSCPPAVRVRADRWVNDGLALVGDAAVNVNPVTSQGASVALESGIRLATVVKRCFQRGDLSAHSLAPYEAWCRPEAEAVQELGDNSLRFFSSHSRVLGYIKERSLRKLESNISMKLKFMGGFCGLWWLAPDGIGWRDALAAAGFWPTSRHTVR